MRLCPYRKYDLLMLLQRIFYDVPQIKFISVSIRQYIYRLRTNTHSLTFSIAPFNIHKFVTQIYHKRQSIQNSPAAFSMYKCSAIDGGRRSDE